MKSTPIWPSIIALTLDTLIDFTCSPRLTKTLNVTNICYDCDVETDGTGQKL